MKPRGRRKPGRVEVAVVDVIVRLLTRMGASVYRAQQYGWAASDPGQPDLTVFLPSLVTEADIHLYVECKAPLGVVSKHQDGFRKHCDRAGIPYVVARSTEDVLDWLHDYGTGHVRRLPDGTLAVTQAALRVGAGRPGGPLPGERNAPRPEALPATLAPQHGTQGPP